MPTQRSGRLALVRAQQPELLLDVLAQHVLVFGLGQVELALVQVGQQRLDVVRHVGVHDLGAAGALVER